MLYHIRPAVLLVRIPASILLGIAFPCAVALCYWRQVRNDWRTLFAWLVLAEPVGRAELDELTFGVYTAQGAAQRFDNPQAQLSARRLQDRHAELRLAASAGLWRVRVLTGAADQ